MLGHRDLLECIQLSLGEGQRYTLDRSYVHSMGLTCTLLDCGRKLEYPEKTPHRRAPAGVWNRNPLEPCCGATVLTTSHCAAPKNYVFKRFLKIGRDALIAFDSSFHQQRTAGQNHLDWACLVCGRWHSWEENSDQFRVEAVQCRSSMGAEPANILHESFHDLNFIRADTSH